MIIATLFNGGNMSTFVLVHGAWSGAHGFRKVRRQLQAQGHEVYAPALTGIGERSHLASPQVNLSTHIQDVVNQVLYEDLHDLVLLGFSYGGMVVTGCLEHISDRVKHLVYMDAFVPQNGQSVTDMVSLRGASTGLGAPAFLPPAARAYDDPEEAEFQNPRRVPQPIATFSQAVRLRQPLESFAFTRTYIRATQDDHSQEPDQQFEKAAVHAREPSLLLHRQTHSMGKVASIADMWHPASRYRFAGNL
jgi:pimeloyl-ACP methyl ester carboxylesterase